MRGVAKLLVGNACIFVGKVGSVNGNGNETDKLRN